jgi:methyl-accepting chemotaxis protein
MGIIVILAAAAIVFLLCLIIYLTLSRLVIKPVMNVVSGLDDSADHVTTASGELSSAAHQLAEGAAEQAASLEETSASLEEISAMARRNADNAAECNTLMKEVNTVVEKANRSMTAQTAAMEEISKASEETSKIIKTIDEIAFQTNLLALNAAVEAARAGEAGAGFAVVADEVRNLAMRAAKAAQDTASLIEGTVNKVKEGAELATQTNEDFAGVTSVATKVGSLVGEINLASNEQTQGLQQVSTAMHEIDRVTQQNAASSEEVASTSEEFGAQAKKLKQFVGDLVVLVKGGSKSGEQALVKPTVGVLPEQEERPVSRALVAPPARTVRGVKDEPKRDTAGPGSGKQKAAEVIPFDDDDFEDF